MTVCFTKFAELNLLNIIFIDVQQLLFIQCLKYMEVEKAMDGASWTYEFSKTLRSSALLEIKINYNIMRPFDIVWQKLWHKMDVSDQILGC